MSSFRRKNKKSLSISPLTSAPPLKKRKIYSTQTDPIHFELDSESNSSPSPSPLPTKNGIQPWWIGQRIIVKTLNTKKKKKQITKKIASIRDYNPFSKLTHIWFEKDGHFENVNLLTLDAWSIANNDKISEKLEFIPDNDWIPVYYETNQHVLVKSDCLYDFGSEIVGVIDGYDAISRRHHVQYMGGQISEWLWATKQRVKIYNKISNDKQFKTHFILPPPWNPEPYGLDKMFASKSQDIEQNRWTKQKGQKKRIISKTVDKKKKKKKKKTTFDNILGSLQSNNYTIANILSESIDSYEAAQILCALKHFQ